jgi:hypothetical protein
MVKSTEESLQKLQFRFAKNGHSKLAEFEVIFPAYFRVVVEPNNMPKSRPVFLIPGIMPPKGTTVDIRYDLDANDEDISLALDRTREFIQTLVEILPTMPWIGLDRQDRSREEKRWKELLSKQSF